MRSVGCWLFVGLVVFLRLDKNCGGYLKGEERNKGKKRENRKRGEIM